MWLIQSVLSLLMNIVMIFTYTRTVSQSLSLFEIQPIPYIDAFFTTETIFTSLGYLQLLTSLIIFFFWWIIESPLVLREHWRLVGKDVRERLSDDN